MNASTTHKSLRITAIVVGSVVTLIEALLVVVLTAGGLFVPARYLGSSDTLTRC